VATHGQGKYFQLPIGDMFGKKLNLMLIIDMILSNQNELVPLLSRN
jgi:hypothetical protein